MKKLNIKETEKIIAFIYAGYKRETIAKEFDMSVEELDKIVNEYYNKAKMDLQYISEKYFSRECERTGDKNIVAIKGFSKSDVKTFGRALLAYSRIAGNY